MTNIDTNSFEGVKPHILTTKSVNSPVFKETGHDADDVAGGEAETFGHVLLLDYDNTTPEQLNDELDQLDGVSLVAESSPGSYHVWNLSVRTFEETALKMLGTKCDMGHCRPGYRRGYWRLRIGAKVRKVDDIYKKRPMLKAVVVNSSTHYQSEAHYRLAEGLWTGEMPDQRPSVPAAGEEIREHSVPWVGKSLTSSEYATYTEELKEALDHE